LPGCNPCQRFKNFCHVAQVDNSKVDLARFPFLENWRIPEKLPRKLANFLYFSETFALGSSYSHILLVAEWRIFGKKKHTLL